MKSIIIVGLSFTCALIGQQPPAKDYSLQKPVDLIRATVQLRECYQKTVDANFETIQTHILQKTEGAQNISQTDFGRIIDRENDATILEQLSKLKQLIKTMDDLEEKLKKTDSVLTQHPKDILELWSEHEIEQQMGAIQKDLFESIMQLSYHQAIRTHQKASEIRGAVVKMPKP
ncbi:hypothetical protein BH09DEP1_BH09DEP1_0280 [soil metagenome]